ncbi:uncharacterized protein LOC144355733 [Saccoglossus kowalevskii]
MWMHIAEDINDASNIQVKRQYFPEVNPDAEFELHAFADASPKAYGAVIYLRCAQQTSFVMAKTRIAPMTETMLPRLELMATLIAARLNSQITLHWLSSNKKLPIFVNNRVDEICEFQSTRKYCPTEENPADLLARWITYENLENSDLWWKGPRLPTTSEWPTCPAFDANVLHSAIEPNESHLINPHTRGGVNELSAHDVGIITTPERENTIDNQSCAVTNLSDRGIHQIMDISRYNDLDKLLRVTSYVLRFISRIKSNDINTGIITGDELNRAENIRFAARRSLPSRMLSDNASTYIFAADEIRTLFDTPEVRDFLAAHRVQWTFIPKRDPWYGGFWERLIGLTKNAIKKTLGRALITFDELSTEVTEVDAVLNGRPLTWSTEYLTALRERHPTTGSKGNTMKVGDVVIIHSDVDKRQKWHLGTVTKLVYGNDQLVRSAELNNANGPTNRPIHKLYPLEIVSKELTSPESNNQSDVGLPAETIQNIGLTADKDVTTTQMTGDTIPKRPTRYSAVAARIRIADLM